MDIWICDWNELLGHKYSVRNTNETIKKKRKIINVGSLSANLLLTHHGIKNKTLLMISLAHNLSRKEYPKRTCK